jgi:hypothetical protein
MASQIMNNNFLTPINKKIYRQFPEFSGIQPSIQRLAPSNKSSQDTHGTYLLIYRKQVHVENNHTMTRVMRVVVSEQGKIIKVTTSR